MSKFQHEITFIKNLYGNKDFTPLHEPIFSGNERKYVLDAIDSTYVSSVGKYVDTFEQMIKQYTGARHAIAVVNGTSALHISLLLAGVAQNDLVITQALSFVATCNAISYLGAKPAFIDVDEKTLGMSPQALATFLKSVELKNNVPYHIPSGKKIGACVPMHTFGIPAEIDKIVALCAAYNIPVVEDAAESIGSLYQGKHTGTFGLLGTYSFNGNKTITCGGGGIILTNDDNLGYLAKHLTTQAKMPHKWEYKHDFVGYNYRCPNLNAALACAQLEQLDTIIENKRKTALQYETFFAQNSTIKFVSEPDDTKANYWLNAIMLASSEDKNQFLEETNSQGVMTRPCWGLLNTLPMFSECHTEDLTTSQAIEATLINLPSSYRI